MNPSHRAIRFVSAGSARSSAAFRSFALGRALALSCLWSSLHRHEATGHLALITGPDGGGAPHAQAHVGPDDDAQRSRATSHRLDRGKLAFARAIQRSNEPRPDAVAS